MLRSLHVIHASVCVIAYVRNLLVAGVSEFLLSSDEVIVVKFQNLFVCEDIKVDVIVSHVMLPELLGDLQSNLCLFFLILIIWVDKHELVVMSDIEVLLNGLFALINVSNLNGFLLDQELRVLVDKERREVVHFPLLLRDGVSLIEL